MDGWGDDDLWVGWRTRPVVNNRDETSHDPITFVDSVGKETRNLHVKSGPGPGHMVQHHRLKQTSIMFLTKMPHRESNLEHLLGKMVRVYDGSHS